VDESAFVRKGEASARTARAARLRAERVEGGTGYLLESDFAGEHNAARMAHFNAVLGAWARGSGPKAKFVKTRLEAQHGIKVSLDTVGRLLKAAPGAAAAGVKRGRTAPSGDESSSVGDEASSVSSSEGEGRSPGRPKEAGGGAKPDSVAPSDTESDASLDEALRREAQNMDLGGARRTEHSTNARNILRRLKTEGGLDENSGLRSVKVVVRGDKLFIGVAGECVAEDAASLAALAGVLRFGGLQTTTTGVIHRMMGEFGGCVGETAQESHASKAAQVFVRARENAEAARAARVAEQEERYEREFERDLARALAESMEGGGAISGKIVVLRLPTVFCDGASEFAAAPSLTFSSYIAGKIAYEEAVRYFSDAASPFVGKWVCAIVSDDTASASPSTLDWKPRDVLVSGIVSSVDAAPRTGGWRCAVILIPGDSDGVLRQQRASGKCGIEPMSDVVCVYADALVLPVPFPAALEGVIEPLPLVNTGNTCFLNAGLQFIGASAEFCTWVSTHASCCASRGHLRFDGGVLGDAQRKLSCGSCSLHDTLCQLQGRAAEQAASTPHDLLRVRFCLGPVGKYVPGDIGDADELLGDLLESGGHNANGGAAGEGDSETVAQSLVFGSSTLPFVFKDRQVLCCLDCNRIRTKDADCTQFILAPAGATVLDRIKGAFAPEFAGAFLPAAGKHAIEDERIICEHCGGKRNHARARIILKFPRAWKLTIKQIYNAAGGKVGAPLEVEEFLDLRGFVSASNLRELEEGGEVAPSYRLKAVLFHKGGLANAGHYFGCRVNGAGNWTTHNDSQPLAIVGNFAALSALLKSMEGSDSTIHSLLYEIVSDSLAVISVSAREDYDFERPAVPPNLVPAEVLRAYDALPEAARAPAAARAPGSSAKNPSGGSSAKTGGDLLLLKSEAAPLRLGSLDSLDTDVWPGKAVAALQAEIVAIINDSIEDAVIWKCPTTHFTLERLNLADLRWWRLAGDSEEPSMAWLRSSLITAFFLQLRAYGAREGAPLRAYCATTYFMVILRSQGAAKAFRKFCKGFDASFKYFLCPMNIKDSHWVLGVVDIVLRKVSVWDPLCVTRENLERELLDFANQHLGGAYAVTPQPSNLPKQRDAWNCGVFLCAFAFLLCRGRAPAGEDVSGSNMAFWRQLIGFCCINGKIIE
jgi:hypothetical protein